MALYAFDGTWNIDHPDDEPAPGEEREENKDTNVVRFRDLYKGALLSDYRTGVGTRLAGIGHLFGGVFGAGGMRRVEELYAELGKHWRAGDHVIDVVGFSRGAALAVQFCNMIAKEGVKDGDEVLTAPDEVKIRFLGIWDLVASFGLSFDTVVDFQSINLGYEIDTIPDLVENCFHAMALDERRESFAVTRLNANHSNPKIKECWFRGVHSNVGGGFEDNVARSNIALGWMIENAIALGLPIDQDKAAEPKYAAVDRGAPVNKNRDPKLDARRKVFRGDEVHESATGEKLDVGQARKVTVCSELRSNWANVGLVKGEKYVVTVPADKTWTDGNIPPCGPDGWKSEDQPWIRKQLFKQAEKYRRLPEAEWFELVGAIGDDDKLVNLFRLGQAAKSGGHEITASQTGDLWLFANDLNSQYGNNKGCLPVTIERIA